MLLASLYQFGVLQRRKRILIPRAKHQCAVGIPNYKDLKKSALGRLLNLDTNKPDEIVEKLQALGPEFQFERVTSTETTPFVPRDDNESLIPPPSMPRS